MIKNLRSLIGAIFILSIVMPANAQLASAIVGVDGLTCSACSFATEKSILKLEFVDSVKMELEKNIATVYFKKGAQVSIKALAQKVYDAGFAVRSIDAVFQFDNKRITDNYCLEYNNDVYHFIKIDKERQLDGLQSIRFIGDKFMPKKEFKSWKMFCQATCKPPSPLGTEYFVTLR